MVRTFLLAAVGALALGACTSTSATDTANAAMPTDRDCFLADRVNGYDPIDDHHVRITVGPNRHYTLTTMQNAHQLDFTQHVALRSRLGWVCTGTGVADIEIIGGNSFRQTFVVTEVTRDPEPQPAAPQGS